VPQLTTELILSGVTCAVDEQSMPPSPESHRSVTRTPARSTRLTPRERSHSSVAQAY